MIYDYLIIGSGFFGSTFARLMTDRGRRCLVIEKRHHIGGNAFTSQVDDIDVHEYGPHIFHTDNEPIWRFVNRFAEFNRYTHTVKTLHQNRLYSLPFNMNTFYELWGTLEPKQAMAMVESQRLKLLRDPMNLEEQALTMVGRDIYEKFIRDYTTKQWQRSPVDLPTSIIKRLPMRWTYDESYFADLYQGIPRQGYTKMFENMLDGIDVKLNVDYFESRDHWNQQARQIVYTGAIDQWFGYDQGELEYRTLDFEKEILEIPNYQGASVINYADPDVAWTRIIEHKHFKKCRSDRTVITREIPVAWSKNKIPYYPINDNKNQVLYNAYRDRAKSTNVIFGGRLAEYRYYDMHQVIGSAMKIAQEQP